MFSTFEASESNLGILKNRFTAKSGITLSHTCRPCSYLLPDFVALFKFLFGRRIAFPFVVVVRSRRAKAKIVVKEEQEQSAKCGSV